MIIKILKRIILQILSLPFFRMIQTDNEPCWINITFQTLHFCHLYCVHKAYTALNSKLAFTLFIYYYFIFFNHRRRVLLVWKTLNRIAPSIENICYNEKTCIVFLKQTISPRLFPLIHFEFPVTVILKFDEENGIVKIKEHEEHWTIEGQ